MFRQTQRSHFFGEWAVLCFSNCSDLFGSKNTVLEVRLFYQQLRWYSEVLRWWTRPPIWHTNKGAEWFGYSWCTEACGWWIIFDHILIESSLWLGYNKDDVFLIFKLWRLWFFAPFETICIKWGYFFLKANGSHLRFSGVQWGGEVPSKGLRLIYFCEQVALQGTNISPPWEILQSSFSKGIF